MKRTLILMAAVMLGCSFSTRVVATDTPADPKFNAVEWYKCELGTVKYKVGLEEKTSKDQCLKTEKVATGNAEINATPYNFKGTTMPVYYAVMSKAAAQYFEEKGYKRQCDRTGEGGFRFGYLKRYALSPTEMSESDGNKWVEDEFAKKGLVVYTEVSFRSDDVVNDRLCNMSEQTCQFYSEQTKQRFGLFKTVIPNCAGAGK